MTQGCARSRVPAALAVNSLLALSSSDSIDGDDGGAGGASITFTVYGDDVLNSTGSPTPKLLAQGQLPNAAGTVIAAPPSGHNYQIKSFFLVNETAAPVTASIYGNGAAPGNKIFGSVIPANGSANLTQDGWKVYDANGAIQ